MPLMVLGGSLAPIGADLSAMGATNCQLYVNYFLTLPLAYTVHKDPALPAITTFESQIPTSTGLLDLNLFAQFADDESGIAAKDRTNPAGLTTSNAVQIKIASTRPDLGMSIVTSGTIASNAGQPTRGEVNVTIGPVMRLLY